MNTTKVEKAGVRLVEEFIDNAEILNATFATNDKGITWDGNIEVYKNNDHNKETFLENIPTQIKARTVKKISKDKAKIQMDISDIRNFKKGGGVILFKIELHGRDKKLFYKIFLPYDLNIILLSCKTDSKTISIELDHIGVYESEQFSILCKRFLIDRKEQSKVVDYDFPNTEINNVMIHGVMKEGSDIIDFLTSGEHFLYGKGHAESKLYEYVTKVKIKDVVTKFEVAVFLDEKKYYDQYRIQKLSDSIQLYLGNNIILKFSEGQVEVKYHIKGNLEERKNDIRFLINLSISKELRLGDKIYSIENTHSPEEGIDKLNTNLEYLENVSKVMKHFGVDDKKVNFDNATKMEFANLDSLIENIVKDKPLPEHIKNSGKYRIKIGEIYIVAFVLTDQDGKTAIFDINNIQSLTTAITETDDSGKELSKKVFSSVYVILSADDIINGSNIDIDKILLDIKSYEINSLYLDAVNRFSLNLIHAFDKTKNKKYLDFATDLYEWLGDSNIGEDIIVINKLQISKRNGKISSVEKRVLNEMLITDDNRLKAAIYILLDDFESFDNEFNLLNEVQRKEFLTYPIYNLVKNKKS